MRCQSVLKGVSLVDPEVQGTSKAKSVEIIKHLSRDLLRNIHL